MPPDARRRHRATARHAHAAGIDPLDLDDAVTALELDAELTMRAADIAAGLIPPDARRALHPHELAARISYAAIDDAVDGTASGIRRRIVEDRARMVRLLATDLRRQGTGAGVVTRLLDLDTTVGLDDVHGATDVLTAATGDIRRLLDQAAAGGAARALQEAALQGVTGLPVIAPLSPSAAGQLDQLAQRAAVSPHSDLVRALREHAVAVATPAHAGDLVDDLERHAATLAESPLDGYAKTAAAGADGLGRQAAALAANPPRRIYAGELLDRATCGPCSLIDGHEYPNLEAAIADYPTGTYRLCEGGVRCRGTLVYVWGDEAPPTLAVPGDRPLPGAGGPGGPPLPESPPIPPAPRPPAPPWAAPLDAIRADLPADVAGWTPRTVDPVADLARRAQLEQLVVNGGRVVDDEAGRRLAELNLPTPEALQAELDDAWRNSARILQDDTLRPADTNRLWEENQRRIAELEAAYAQGVDAWQRAAADVYRAVLAEVRPMGPGQVAQRFANGSDAAVAQDLVDVFDNFPSQWLDASARRGPILTSAGARGGYLPAPSAQLPGRIVLSGARGQRARVATHELGHRMEDAVAQIRSLEAQFIRRRTTLPDGRLEQSRWIGQPYPASEITRADKFVDPYMGKDYAGGADPADRTYYEVMSTGLEGLFGGSFSGLRGDADMRQFVLGVLALV